MHMVVKCASCSNIYSYACKNTKKIANTSFSCDEIAIFDYFLFGDTWECLKTFE